MSQPWIKPMKLFFITATTALLFTSPTAQGQTLLGQNAPIVTSKINLSLEQRHQIGEIIKELKIEEVTPELHVAIGDTVSKSVPLHPMPADVTGRISQVKSHLFFMTGGQVAIVDPKNNEIVDLIK